MLFYRFKSDRQSNVNLSRYLIDWNDSPSKEQRILQDFLYPYWKSKVILAEFRIPGSKFRVDILNITDRIGMEYSPESTHDFNPFFHKDRNAFLRRVVSDIEKLDWLKENNFKDIEINKEDLSYLSKKFFLDKFNILL
jgi:hypothetical protein